MTGDYAEQHYGCPFDSIGCARCIWSKFPGCELLTILMSKTARLTGEEK